MRDETKHGAERWRQVGEMRMHRAWLCYAKRVSNLLDSGM
jgi:hypothetical protein